MYKYLFKNNNVKKDPTNNSEPQKIISELTNYIRNENIFNYQVSHIFGRTKNIFLFEAPWNIAFVPKVMDPFTGHESTGVLQKEYKEKFQSHASKLYAEFIEEYNYLITRPDISEGILYYIDDLKKQRDVKEVLDFKNSVLAELSVIGTDTATISKKL
ncbi:MAG: hypothetical protein A2Y22_08780 [Clostridiales bacterium GWD2_32_59]|nr:MAG: hypothetical protein A2Y22_08780 [Clostridiales bacterium GWD2_32_59]